MIRLEAALVERVSVNANKYNPVNLTKCTFVIFEFDAHFQIVYIADSSNSVLAYSTCNKWKNGNENRKRPQYQCLSA